MLVLLVINVIVVVAIVVFLVFPHGFVSAGKEFESGKESARKNKLSKDVIGSANFLLVLVIGSANS